MTIFKKSISTVALLCSGLLLAPSVFAQTADGETPAEELVCEQAGLTGALKGLCNAYCEAMDCDSENPYASDKACDKVAANFANHDKEGVGLPCEEEVVPVCPCDFTFRYEVDENGAIIPEDGVCYFNNPNTLVVFTLFSDYVSVVKDVNADPDIITISCNVGAPPLQASYDNVESQDAAFEDCRAIMTEINQCGE